MSQYVIRSMELAELKDFYNHIERDFAAGEYPPYDVLYQQLQKGVQEGLILCEGERDVAYSICAQGHANKLVLISLLAVFNEFRSGGVGSAFLKALSTIYSNREGIIVEVEKPEEAKTQDERASREKRIQFYEKAGFCLVPDIDYSIWDVPMHLMVLAPSKSVEIIFKRIGQIMYEIYLELMGKRYIHKMKFITKHRK